MKIHVNYPVMSRRLILRTSNDWDKDVEPEAHSAVGAVFDVDCRGSTISLKACLRDGIDLHWCRGADYVLSAHDPDPDLWPYFFESDRGTVSEVMVFSHGDRSHSVRVYLPPGYAENHLRSFPVLYMQDGQNLFFPQEAFGGREWRVDETMDRLDQMNAVRKAIVVGISPHDRHVDYTQPGYESYGHFITEVLKPKIDDHFRTRRSARDTVVMGSSLGGVVSLYLAWEYPQVFGGAACLSSTFGYRDDLFDRIACEEKRAVRLYIDSGWPRDNFDATNAMRDLLMHRGFRLGVDLLQFSFPDATHNEGSWAGRLHLPFQYFFGRAGDAERNRSVSPEVA